VTFRRDKTEIREPGGLWDESLAYHALFGGVMREHELEWRFGSAGARARIKFDGLQYEKDAISWKGAQITLIQFDPREDTKEIIILNASCSIEAQKGTSLLSTGVRDA
jgi:hypothetical protein